MKSILIFILTVALSFCSSASRKEASSYYDESKPGVSSSLAGLSDGEKSGTVSAAAAADTVQPNKMIVYNATVRIKSDQIQDKIAEMTKLAESFQGFVLSMNTNGNMVLKIPGKSLREFLNSVKKSVKEYYEEISANDVSEEYHDTALRLENAKKTRVRLLELYKQAKNVEDVLKIEAELGKTSETIERMEGRVKFLTDQVSYSRVTVYISPFYHAPPARREKEYKPGILGYPIYWAYKGLGYLYDGIVWLFITEEKEEPEKTPKK